MIIGVGDDVKQGLAARHDALIVTDQREAPLLVHRRVCQFFAPRDVPVIDRLLLAPKISERRMIRRIAHGETVFASLEMRLSDQVDDIEVIERMHYLREEARPLAPSV